MEQEIYCFFVEYHNSSYRMLELFHKIRFNRMLELFHKTRYNLCMFVSVCVRVFIHNCVCMCLYTCVCLCLYPRVCVCVCLCSDMFRLLCSLVIYYNLALSSGNKRIIVLLKEQLVMVSWCVRN